MIRRVKIKEISPALWIPLVWLVLSSSRGRISPQALGSLDYIQGSGVLRLIYIGLILLSIYILFLRGFSFNSFFVQNKCLVLLFLFMGASILWSVSPDISFRRWIKTVGTLLMTLLVVTDSKPLQSFSCLLRRFSYAVLPLSLLLILFFPEYGRLPLADGRLMWVGICSFKNTLAQAALIGALYFSWILLEQKSEPRRFVDIVFLGLSLFLMVGSESMTAILTYVGVMGALLAMRIGKVSMRHIGIIMIYLALLAGPSYVVVQELIIGKPIAPLVVQSVGRDMTLTGRTALWNDIFQISMERPILGHGFGGFWGGNMGNKLWVEYDWQPVDSHNGYLDAFLEQGLIGFLLLILFILRAYHGISLSFSLDYEYATIRMMLFIMAVIHNMNESSFCNLNHPFWLLFLFAAIAPGTVENEGDQNLEEPGAVSGTLEA